MALSPLGQEHRSVSQPSAPGSMHVRNGTYLRHVADKRGRDPCTEAPARLRGNSAFELVEQAARECVMLQPMPSVRGSNSCDYCRRFLGDGYVIAGGPESRKQFCSFACYDNWRQELPPCGADRS